MSALFIAALLAAGPAVAAPPAASEIAARAEACGDTALRHARAPLQASPRKLGELPPAKAYLAVYREVDRCPAPIIVRADIGFIPRAAVGQPGNGTGRR